MTGINGFYQERFPSSRICKVLEEPPISPWQLDNPARGWPFQLDFTFAGKAYCLNTSTGPGGCFQVEDTPLDDGTGRTIADLLAQGRPDFPWSGNDFPITIRERPVPGSHLEAIRVDNGCPGQSILTAQGDCVVFRYRRGYPVARAVFTRDFFGLKACSDEYAAPPVNQSVPLGQSVPFCVELAYETGLSGQEQLCLTARLLGAQSQIRLPRGQGRYDAVSFLFTLPDAAGIALTSLTLNGARIPDAAAAQPGHCVAMLPADYAPANSPFVLEGYAAFTQRGRQLAPGESFSFSVELLPSPYARFVNCPRGLPPDPPCRPPSPPPCPPSPPPCPPSPPPCPPSPPPCLPSPPPCPPSPPPCPPSPPPCPPSPPPCPPGVLQVRAYKQVRGGTLRAGQFEFVLERNDGFAVARGSNDSAGWVHFTFIPRIALQPQGEWFIMREAQPRCSAPGWKLDRTRYQVFVRPCDQTVIYHGPQGLLSGVPIFTNVFRKGPSISGMKRTPTGRPVPGWRILLHREQDREDAAPFRSQVTDCRGRYCFDGLPRGRYRVTEAPREGWQSVGCNRYMVTLKNEPVCGIDFINERIMPSCPPWPEDSCQGYRPSCLPPRDENPFCPPY